MPLLRIALMLRKVGERIDIARAQAASSRSAP
jgi:hypothetical protein